MSKLRKDVNRRKEAEAELKAARADINAGIIALLRDGKKPADIVGIAEVSYEKVRTLARAHGIEPLREPTVTSKKRADP